MARTIDHLVVHCAATRPSANIGAAEIDRMHKNRGWKGCGYHVVIRRDGEIEMREKGDPTRPLDQVGAHVGDIGSGWNSRSIGISLVGGVHETKMQGRHPAPEDNFTPAQFDALAAVLADMRGRFPKTRICGHNDLIRENNASPKACPVFNLKSFLDERSIDPDTRDGQQATVEAPNLNDGMSVDTISYEIEPGDTLSGIARQFGTTVDFLVQRNGIANANQIAVGDIIVVRG